MTSQDDTPQRRSPAPEVDHADVVIVGAGPAGSAMAATLAAQGADVALVEKSRFPRDKICGDGLTPRAVKELLELGVDTTGWQRSRGLRIKGGGHTLEMDWPSTDAFPSYGLVRTRAQLDEELAQFAVQRGARLFEGVSVTGPVRDERTDRIVGVTAKRLDERGRSTDELITYRAPIVIASDGVSSRLAVAAGRTRRTDRVMATAVRAYYRTPRRDDYLESHLELMTTDEAGQDVVMPGYGWIFPLEDGRANVGLGMLDTSPAYRSTDYKDVMTRWIASMAQEWSFELDESAGPIRGAALPMGFNRSPMYADGLLLTGDAAGMVNPFNGEGIDYALQAARVGGSIVVDALAQSSTARQDETLARFSEAMRAELGGYFTLGRWFARAIGHSEVMRLALRFGLPRTTLMRFMLKLMANLPDPGNRDASDRVINALVKVAPDA